MREVLRQSPAGKAAHCPTQRTEDGEGEHGEQDRPALLALALLTAAGVGAADARAEFAGCARQVSRGHHGLHGLPQHGRADRQAGTGDVPGRLRYRLPDSRPRHLLSAQPHAGCADGPRQLERAGDRDRLAHGRAAGRARTRAGHAVAVLCEPLGCGCAGGRRVSEEPAGRDARSAAAHGRERENRRRPTSRWSCRSDRLRSSLPS